MSHRIRHARRFSVLAALLLVAALLPAPAAAQFGKNKIQYQNFKWNIYHSPHFDVYYYDAEEPLLQRVVSFAESAYDELSRRLDYQIESSTPLIFYKTHAEFEQNNVDLGFIPEAVGAFATDVRFRMVLPVDLPDAELHQLILHELTHIFQYHLLFGGKVTRSLTSQPPTWLVEGMASYYASDESTSDKMFLRDLVVNDLVPQIAKPSGGLFLQYRFGHAVFDFMESKWGAQGVLDFLFEYRSTLGGNIDRALRRAFRVEPEDFDADFRRWLREKYLPELVKTGEPSYFGRRFFQEEGRSAQFLAPAVSPSGDLVASLGNPKADTDVVLFDTRERKAMRNLTRGWSSKYQYLSGQFITGQRRFGGSDLAFSPDGNWIAAFARREKGRSLLLIDVVHGGVDRIIDFGVQQPSAPSWSPDGKTIAFSGNVDGKFDIFLLDVESGQVRNLTNDERFDGGAVFTPDGQGLVWSSEVGEYLKLFRLALAHPELRRPITRGEWNDLDPTFTKDGKTLFYSSDRNGFENIYSLDLTNGEVRQHTNAVTGAFMPQVVERADGTRALIYVGYWKTRFDLYRGDLDKQPEVLETIPDVAAAPPTPSPELERYEPDIQVTINDENKERYRGLKLFLEDGDAGVGVTSDQRVISQTQLIFSDYLGDRRLFVILNSVSSFSDFNVVYLNLAKRLQWGANLFDSRDFFVGLTQSGRLVRDQALRRTGASGFVFYPLDFYHRFETSLGVVRREYDFQSLVFDPQGGTFLPFIEPRTDTYPELRLGFVGDTTVEAPWGPISGRRYRIEGSYGAAVGGSDNEGTINPGASSITSSAILDFRQYVPFTQRMGFAFRAVGLASWGQAPDVFAFGGLDTVRGFDFRELVGDRAFYTNLELRFPLVDAVVLPFAAIQGIRGRIFLDVGGAWFDYAGQTFKFWDNDNSRLSPDNPLALQRGPRSAYGWGFTANLLGLELNWDFAKRWDGKETFSKGFETSFWVGSRF